MLLIKSTYCELPHVTKKSQLPHFDWHDTVCVDSLTYFNYFNKSKKRTVWKTGQKAQSLIIKLNIEAKYSNIFAIFKILSGKYSISFFTLVETAAIPSIILKYLEFFLIGLHWNMFSTSISLQRAGPHYFIPQRTLVFHFQALLMKKDIPLLLLSKYTRYFIGLHRLC